MYFQPTEHWYLHFYIQKGFLISNVYFSFCRNLFIIFRYGPFAAVKYKSDRMRIRNTAYTLTYVA